MSAKLVYCTDGILFWETCGFARNYRFVGDLHLGGVGGGTLQGVLHTPACDIAESKGILIRERQISSRPGLIRLTLILPRIRFSVILLPMRWWWRWEADYGRFGCQCLYVDASHHTLSLHICCSLKSPLARHPAFIWAAVPLWCPPARLFYLVILLFLSCYLVISL